jgi:dTDP-glucose 4,6-dehydratase
MKILVTGGLGFIGSNFILNILSKNKNISIINLDDKLFGSNSLSLKKIESLENYEFVKGNITDNQLISKMVEKCDSVINFAAESHVDRSISNAKPFIDSNIYGVFTILEAIKKFGKKLVHVSTDEVFGSLEKESADENYRFNPSSPYSASKASAELLINSFFVTYDCDCMITRCTNNYGPRQFLEKLIPKAIFYSNNNKKIPIYGTGKNIRDWIHVDDHCEAIFKVLQNGKKGSSYNISSDNEIDNITIIKKILDIMKKPEEMIEYVNDRPGHDFRYSMNSSKIRKELGWSPKISFEKGLENTINWYLENEKWWKNISQESLVPEWQKKK